MLSAVACQKPGPDPDAERTAKIELKQLDPETNSQGDELYRFVRDCTVGFSTDYGDSGTFDMRAGDASSMEGSCQVKNAAKTVWCYTPGGFTGGKPFTVPAGVVKASASSSAEVDGMAFMSTAISLADDGLSSGFVRPLTSGVVIDILDSRPDRWVGTRFHTVTISGDAPLAGDINLMPGETNPTYTNASHEVVFDCSGATFIIGPESNPTSLGAVVLPGKFSGTITVAGNGVSVTFRFEGDNSLQFEAGYIRHIRLDVATASETTGKNFYPKRLGILGDSISTFSGKIPSSHRTYYPTTNAACSDVDKWEKTYWGRLINDYWHCELDINSSWSGSCVAPGDPTVERTPFVQRCSLFKDPDAIIVFGGTNDCQTERQIGLGSFDFTTSVDQLVKYRRFRESYIWVLKTLKANYPKAQLICIIGNHIEGDYGNSIVTIASELEIPFVDFRRDYEVTLYEQLHPNAAGHAHMAKKIFEETEYLFK